MILPFFVKFLTTLYRICLVPLFCVTILSIQCHWTASSVILDSIHRTKTKLNATLWKFVTSCYFVDCCQHAIQNGYLNPTRLIFQPLKPLHFASDVWCPIISSLKPPSPVRRRSHWLLSFCYSNKPNPGVCVVCAPASLAWFLPHLPPPETTGRNIQKAIPKRGVLTDWKIRQHRTICRGGTLPARVYLSHLLWSAKKI